MAKEKKRYKASQQIIKLFDCKYQKPQKIQKQNTKKSESAKLNETKLCVQF